MEVESPTLFVADVPYGLPEADFIDLFRQCDGFVAARLRSDKNDNRVGFVDFDSQQAASAARDRLQGHKFSELDPGLNVHFSKQRDSRGKRNRDSYDDMKGQPFQAATRPHAAAAYAQSHPMSMFSSPYSMQPGMPGGSPFPSAYGSHIQNMNSMYPSLPPEASATLYVEGLPSDATEREVSHIFRPFTGYSSLRILQKESKAYPSRTYNLCFIEFDNKYQATVAMHALQGYRMDKNDTKGLTLSYAKSDRKEQRRRGDGQQPGQGQPGAHGGGKPPGPAPATPEHASNYP